MKFILIWLKNSLILQHFHVIFEKKAGSTPATRTNKTPVTAMVTGVFNFVWYTLRYTFSISDDFCERGVAVCCDTIQVSILQMTVDTLGVHVLGMSEGSLF